MLTNNKSTDEILEERGNVYGSYKAGVLCRAQIVSALTAKFKETNQVEAPDELKIMFGDLALKLMRFASTPSYDDSLQDLEGYAKLIRDYHKGNDIIDKKGK